LVPEAQWIASLKGLPGDPGASALTDQKFIVYPADFVGTNYTILDADKGKSLVIIKRRYCSYITSSSKDASWLLYETEPVK
jgi:hypothetical protein